MTEKSVTGPEWKSHTLGFDALIGCRSVVSSLQIYVTEPKSDSQMGSVGQIQFNIILLNCFSPQMFSAKHLRLLISCNFRAFMTSFFQIWEPFVWTKCKCS